MSRKEAMPVETKMSNSELFALANTTEPMQQAYLEARLQKSIAALCNVITEAKSLGFQTLEMTILIAVAIDSLVSLQKTRKFAGLYAQVYSALIQHAEKLLAQSADVAVIYQILAPIILCLNTSLYSQPMVMPLTALERDLGKHGYVPSPVHTIYTEATALKLG